MKAKEEAERASDAKSDFLSQMSHELRTPLNSILGFAQLLESVALTDEEHAEFTRNILSAGRHLLRLIDETLDISRIDTGHFPLSPEPVLICEAVREVMDIIAPLSRHGNIHLEVKLAEVEDRYVKADSQRLKQVLLNLLSNAIKFNRQDGSVTLECRPLADNRLHISVSDTGPGIPPEMMAKLFTPFERLGAAQRNIEGTGLGLALSRALVHAMNGRMCVESTVGRGSTFSLELPMAEAPMERHERKSGRLILLHADEPGAMRKVLYIEDNLASLNLVRHLIKRRSRIKLLPAMQGRLGMELAIEHIPDLILLDMNLPDISGNELLQQLQSDERTKDIPVIVISADATKGQIERSLAAGARAYLTKPFDITRFVALLDEMIIEADKADR